MRGELADLRARVVSGNKALEQQLTAINEASASGEKLSAQVKDLTAQLATVRAENARLGGVSDSASALRAELTEVKAKLAEAQKAAEQQGATVAELTGANEKVSGSMRDLQAQVVSLRAENQRLAYTAEQAKKDAEERAAAANSAVASQLASTQRDLAAQRAETARLSDSLQAVERDRVSRVAQLQQENAAIAARLRQAQGTLDQIASAARLLNGNGAAPTMPSSVFSTPTLAPQSAASAPTAPPQPRMHVVQEGDSLTRISTRYYGTTGRWQEIYDANRDVLKG
jgi:nucleoid-associated protein YgaU